MHFPSAKCHLSGHYKLRCGWDGSLDIQEGYFINLNLITTIFVAYMIFAATFSIVKKAKLYFIAFEEEIADLPKA